MILVPAPVHWSGATPSPMRSSRDNAAQGASGSRLPGLVVGALGVVFGDIGTSPLYAMQRGLRRPRTALALDETTCSASCR